MKAYIFSDAELQSDRLIIASQIFQDLADKMGPGRLVFCGDLFRQFNAETVFSATSWMREFAQITGQPPLLIVGNHDREIGMDRLSAVFRGECDVVSSPVVETGPPCYVACLPAPDRAAFGASRSAEGKRERDAALSAALESALIALETQIGSDNLSRAVLFAHAATDGEELGVGQLAGGLTWTIPGARLQRWGRVFLGHVHKPGQIAENVWSVGGIANWTFADKAERFRALVLDTDTFEVTEIPLKRVLVPIEMEIAEAEILDKLLVEIATHYLHGHGVDIKTDTVALKIRARLPQHEMALVPTAEELQEQINDLFERRLIDSCIITREVTGKSKARITSNIAAREMTLEQMLDLYVETSDNGTAPATLDRAKGLLVKVADTYKPGEGTFGFEPISLTVENFRQWGGAHLNFGALSGAVALWGANESGKSNLVEAILFALFKRTPSSTASIEDDLRLGQMRGGTVFRFAARGRRYEVRRALERGRGGVTCKSELLYVDVEPAESVVESAADVDKRIVDLVGSYEFVLSTVFRAQRDLHRLIEATPAVWNKLMHEGLNLDCLEPVRKYAANETENAVLREREAGIRLEQVEGELDGDRQSLETIDRAELQDRRAGLEAHIAQAGEEKASLETQRAALVDKRAVLRESLSGRVKLEVDLREARRELDSIKIADLGAPPEPYELPDTASVERKEHLEADLKAADVQLADLRKQEADGSAALGALERNIKSLTAAAVETQKRLDAWQASKDAAPAAPCETMAVKVDPPIKPGCHYYQLAVHPETGKRLMDEVQSYRHKINEAEGDALTTGLLLADARLKILQEETQRSALAEQLAAVIAALDRNRASRNAIEAYNLRARAQEQLVAQRAAIQERIAKLEAEPGCANDLSTALSETLKEIERIENRIVAQEGIAKAARAALADLEREAAKLSALQDRIDKLEVQAVGLRTEQAIQEELRAAWGLIAEAFHHTGIPYLLMERVIGGFERTCNELLDGTGMTISAETVTPTKKGEARDKLSIRFTDSRGQHALSQASGEQGTLLSIVLSAALSITGSQFWGATPELYIQDEGFGTLDAEHLEVCRELIARIAARFSRFIFITHTSTLAESADVQLRVEAEGGVSRLVA